MRLLTVGLALATAVMAGCSSTAAGSSGAMQDDATAPAASSASSSAVPTAPAPSPDPATPTAEPTGATASPVASPTDSPPPANSPDDPALLGSASYDHAENTDVCDTGLPYACGAFGASGVGTVFYASTTPFACGADMASTCNYLEVAPNGWNGKEVACPGAFSQCGGKPNKTSDWGSFGVGTGEGYQYCSTGEPGYNTPIPNAFGEVIGSGYTNTYAILAVCTTSGAANRVSGYTGGGMTDWYLPSRDEIAALYFYPNRDAIGGFAPSNYWSSTQSENASPLNDHDQPYNNGAYVLHFGNSIFGEMGKEFHAGVRPVRAF
jgi:hypothetical protein